MPWRRSAFACEAQSLHTMQWVRFDTGGLTLGHDEPNAPSCPVRSFSIDCGV